MEPRLLAAAAAAARGGDDLGRRLERLQEQTAAADETSARSFRRLEAALESRRRAARWPTPSADNLAAVRGLAQEALALCEKACTEEAPREQLREARHEKSLVAAQQKVQDSLDVQDLQLQVDSLEDQVRRKREARVLRERMRDLQAQLAALEAEEGQDNAAAPKSR